MNNVTSINTSNKPVAVLFAYYAIPTIFATLVTGLYYFIDGYFVGNYVSSKGLAAIGLLWPWITILLGAGLLIGVGAGCQISLAQGKQQPRLIKFIIGQALLLSIVVSVILGVLLYLIVPYALSFQGSDPQTTIYVEQFAAVIFSCSPIVILNLVTPCLLRNLYAPRLATLLLVCSTLLNILLDYLFILQFNMGISGAAIGTILAELLVIIGGVIFIHYHREYLPSWFKYLTPSWSIIKGIVVNGASSLVMYIYAGFTVFIHNQMLLRYGKISDVAIYTVIGYISTLLYLFLEGLANGMQPIASEFAGAAKYDKVRQVYHLALTWGLALGVLFTLLIEIDPSLFISVFFEHNKELMQSAITPVRLNLMVLFLEAFILVTAILFQAIGSGRHALYITLSNLFIQVPLLLLFSHFFGLVGIWITFPSATLILVIIVLILLRRVGLIHHPHIITLP